MGMAAAALRGVVVLVHLDNMLGAPKQGRSQGPPSREDPRLDALCLQLEG